MCLQEPPQWCIFLVALQDQNTWLLPTSGNTVGENQRLAKPFSVNCAIMIRFTETKYWASSFSRLLELCRVLTHASEGFFLVIQYNIPHNIHLKWNTTERLAWVWESCRCCFMWRGILVVLWLVDLGTNSEADSKCSAVPPYGRWCHISGLLCREKW